MKYLVAFLLLVSGVSWASIDNSNFDEKSESELDLKIKNKLFPGGKDEGQLKIQSNLAQPVRRVTPTTEDSHEETQERD